VRVGVTAHTDEQRSVVDATSFLVIEIEVISQPQRDDALPQHVFHRLAEAEIDPQ